MMRASARPRTRSSLLVIYKRVHVRYTIYNNYTHVYIICIQYIRYIRTVSLISNHYPSCRPTAPARGKEGDWGRGNRKVRERTRKKDRAGKARRWSSNFREGEETLEAGKNTKVAFETNDMNGNEAETDPAIRHAQAELYTNYVRIYYI